MGREEPASGAWGVQGEPSNGQPNRSKSDGAGRREEEEGEQGYGRSREEGRGARGGGKLQGGGGGQAGPGGGGALTGKPGGRSPASGVRAPDHTAQTCLADLRFSARTSVPGIPRFNQFPK